MTIEIAKEVLLIEEQGLAAVRERIGKEFVDAIEIILASPGRLVITGIGKSGLVGQKISATLNSTGTPSFFLHPVEAMHGDLGMVMAGDVVVAISYSGETPELNSLLISLKKRGNKIIAMTGGKNSSLAVAADVVLDIHIPKEACSLGLAPTTSTTATLAMGDALSVVLLNRKKFQAEDFRHNHPGGSLGQRLKVKVTEVMFQGDDIPMVRPQLSAAESIVALNEKDTGVVLVVDENNTILGIVTDGDVRRCVVKNGGITDITAEQLMTKNPICIGPEQLAADALSIMQKHEITALPIVDAEKRLLGLLHLHNLLGKGEFRFLV
ncbi:SIS domain-containing protein [Desulforhopalus sp. IMCC35007]|uniref:KpsF/GutQ family sugar-phosphate isomerase n=1 Tax=Desulforhopalus sp. IMCC35007 TaxID=2569543 RepID=UPI0010AE08A5|nr:KpsF/GutQ family sugar-phosphate isomerase [Desulforhopalus sp. IMCC35007]TKB12164.1 KpsF/GutQ family sugar-phosphate isomerase [Desulforhopalus sp. IMCC35007]